MIRKKPKNIPRKEVFRYYAFERDPNPKYRIFPCDFEEEEVPEDEWH